VVDENPLGSSKRAAKDDGIAPRQNRHNPNRLDKIFDGHLQQVLEAFNGAIWQ